MRAARADLPIAAEMPGFESRQTQVPVVEEDSVIIEFSPAGEYQKTIAALEG
jgi:hypothetical protein